MSSDLRHAFRMLLKKPGFAALAILTLAVGIGANTAIFTVVNGVLLKPLPYSEPERIVRLWEQTARGPRVQVSTPNFLDWRTRATSFETMAAYGGGREAVLGGAQPVFADVYTVSDGFFGVFGVPPAIGRTFAREELAIGGAPAVVVGDAFWRQTLGANRDLQSLQIRVEGLSCRVVGVMPPGFAYPADADIWIPKELFEDQSGRTGHNNSVVARLNPGLALRQADAEMDAIASRIVAEQQSNTDAQSVTMVPLLEAMTGGSRESLLMLLAAVGLVLLIACVNVASTLLARGEERRRELAVRAALGAARSRLVRQLLTENLLLSVAGTVGGVLLSGWLVRTLLYVNPTAFPRPESITVDLPVLLFAGALACLTPLVFGLVPSLQVSRTDLRDALAEGGRSVQAPLRRWVRNGLVGVEVAVTLLLLVGSVLLIRSFHNVLSGDTGFDPSGVITAEMSVPGSKYPTAEQSSGFYRDLLPKLRSIPGVRAAGAIDAFPLSGSDAGGLFVFDGDPDPFASRTSAGYRVVTPGYFEAMGIQVRSGRTIADEDTAGREAVAVVNEDFVSRYVQDGRAIGRRFRFLGMDRINPTLTIVGVVHGVKHASLVRAPVPEVYVSWLQLPTRTRSMTIAVKPATADLAGSVADSMRERVRQADPDVPVELSTLAERMGASVADRRFTMLVLGTFAAIALLLAAVGIYGVLAYSVAQRTQEIGVRMALGADPQSVVRLMLRGAFGPVGVGLVVGLLSATLATRVLQSSLYGVAALDPVAFAAAALVLAGVAWIASYIPARRATRVDPMKALRI